MKSALILTHSLQLCSVHHHSLITSVKSFLGREMCAPWDTQRNRAGNLEEML